MTTGKKVKPQSRAESHGRAEEENPWHTAMRQLDRAAEKMELEPYILERLAGAVRYRGVFP